MNQELRQQVRKRDDHECKFCKNTENLHTHHIVPKKAGGSDSQENLITVCASCHNTIENTQGNALKRIKKEKEKKIKEIKQEILESIEAVTLEKKIHITRSTNLGNDTIWYVGTDEEAAFERYKVRERPTMSDFKVEFEVEVEDIKQAVRESLPAGMFQ